MARSKQVASKRCPADAAALGGRPGAAPAAGSSDVVRIWRPVAQAKAEQIEVAQQESPADEAISVEASGGVGGGSRPDEGHEAEEQVLEPSAGCCGASPCSLPKPTASVSGATVPLHEDTEVEREPEAKKAKTDFAVIVKDAMKSKDAWRQYIEGAAKQLERVQDADYKKTNVWNYWCLVCGRELHGTTNHLTSQKHYKALWNDLESNEFKGDIATYVQAFELAHGRYIFNHLSGEQGWDETRQIGRVFVGTTPEAQPSIGEKVEKHAQGQPPASDAPPPTLQQALADKDAWRTYIAEFATLLDNVFTFDYKVTKAWEHECNVCSASLPSGAFVHLRSQTHWKAVKTKFSERGGSEVAEEQWNQEFDTVLGKYRFNHLTGVQGLVQADGSLEDLKDACAKQEAASAEAKAHKAAAAEASAAAAAAHPEASGTMAAHAAVAKAAKVEASEWRAEQAPEARAEFQIACLSEAKVGGVVPFGYAPCYLHDEFKLSPHRRCCFGWAHDECKRRCFYVKWEIGRFVFVVGVDRTREPAGLPDIWAGDDGEFRVNLVALSLPPAGTFGEVRLEVDTAETSGFVKLSLPNIGSLCYVQIWSLHTELPAVITPSDAMALPPAFSESARGMPKDWNSCDTAPKKSEQSALFWGRKARSQLDLIRGAQVDPNTVLEFLRGRLDSEGKSVLGKLGPPVRQQKGWFSLAWMPFGGQQEECVLRAQGWVRAWHGCKFEALYSIMYHGRLISSSDRARGDRFFHGAPGVYVHKDLTYHKADNYVRFMPLCGDGVFWAAKWEVRVNRAEAVKPPHQTDQWVQPEHAVRLAALWICGRTAEDMAEGSSVSRAWDPELEANPRSDLWAPSGARGDSGEEREDSPDEDEVSEPRESDPAFVQTRKRLLHSRPTLPPEQGGGEVGARITLMQQGEVDARMRAFRGVDVTESDTFRALLGSSTPPEEAVTGTPAADAGGVEGEHTATWMALLGGPAPAEEHSAQAAAHNGAPKAAKTLLDVLETKRDAPEVKMQQIEKAKGRIRKAKPTVVPEVASDGIAARTDDGRRGRGPDARPAAKKSEGPTRKEDAARARRPGAREEARRKDTKVWVKKQR